MKKLLIEFGRSFTLEFSILQHEVAQTWAAKVIEGSKYNLDDPKRFYGFGSKEAQELDALQRIWSDIETINAYEQIVDRTLTNVNDQDTLNYLHNIFERYHGLLNQQDTEWWKNAPDSVHRALARLNIDVHRCEAVSRGNPPRFVCTWWNMPKHLELSLADMSSIGELETKFGSVYLNYVEIGKTLEDLSIDNDHYIGDDAFQPFIRYSADFNVKFYRLTPDVAACSDYYYRHANFFKTCNIDSPTHPLAMPYRYRVADLVTELTEPEILQQIAVTQEITNITVL